MAIIKLSGRLCLNLVLGLITIILLNFNVIQGFIINSIVEHGQGKNKYG